MKKRYLAILLVFMVLYVPHVKALVLGDCKVLASYKLSSSLDEEQYICKGKAFGNKNDTIYYSGEGNEIVLNNYNGYYFTNYDESIVLNISGKSNISFLHLSDTKVKVKGTGTLKFKENSFVKKVINGNAVYQYVYQGKTIVDLNQKVYEGTLEEFLESYSSLKSINKLPEEYNSLDYVLVQAIDYSKMVSVVVTDSWMNKHIDTSLRKSISKGFGIIQYVKEEKKKEASNNTLKSENVILISEDKVSNNYKLSEVDLKNDEIASKVNDSIDESLLSLYDVSVYNGKELVSMKDGKYTIKIKLDNSTSQYKDYKIIYVNDNGDIEEYIDGVIDGEYIVFKTTHLSQYGVIANEVETINVSKVDIKKVTIGNILKISILVLFSVFSATIIGYLIVKNKLLSNKSRKKRRA